MSNSAAVYHGVQGTGGSLVGQNLVFREGELFLDPAAQVAHQGKQCNGGHQDDGGDGQKDLAPTAFLGLSEGFKKGLLALVFVTQSDQLLSVCCGRSGYWYYTGNE